jgi:CRP/FNR family transcriptional regulator, cyclic AMP receptor protein
VPYGKGEAMETLERIVAEHPFLSGLESHYAGLLTGCASNVRFEAGTYIFKEGEDANNFYLIRSGKVALEILPPQNRPITVETLDEGEILGWSWLLPPYVWSFHAHALQDTRAIALDGKCLRAKCEQNHDLGYEVLKRFAQIMARRLQATRFQLLDVYAAR